ncbi:MAG: UPF0164 family protein [Treponema sp.]|nr:UPF0164 family protein [Treponema sp.]
MKHFLLILATSFFLTAIASPAHTLDFTDVHVNLSDAFSVLEGKNEGTTAFRSLMIPWGGKAESLGTAYTGLADDVSCLEYNPGASAVLAKTEAAIFHNSWIADSAMESIAATGRIGNLGLGGAMRCFYIPFSEYNSFGERVAKSYYTETTVLFNIAYNFFAGYYFKGIAVGLNAKAAWRGVPDYTDNNTDAIIKGSGLSQSGLAIAGDAGIMLRFNVGKFFSSRESNFRVGLNILNAGAAITGFGKRVQLDDPLPTSATLGISYRMIKPLMLTLEFRQPFNLLNFSEYHMWSAGIGTQVLVTNFFSVLGGFSLKGANPRISLGMEFTILKNIQMHVNYTLDLTSSANPVNRISASAKLLLGDGGRAEKQKRIDELYNRGLAYFVQYDFEAAIACWNEVLTLDKRFDPAIEGIKSATMELELFQRIRDAQILE